MAKKTNCIAFYGLTLSLFLGLFNVSYAEELFLEGVSILGNKKTASVVYKDQTLSLNTGDKVGEWTIEYIEERRIKLIDTAGKIHTVELHSSLNNGVENVDIVAEPEVKTGGFQPKVIKDEDVPEGHRRVRTPFGDILIKNTPTVAVEKEETD